MLAHACGEVHPSLVTTDHFEVLEGSMSVSAIEVYDYRPEWGLPGEEIQRDIAETMARLGERQVAA